jgi:hypothetical protein
VLAIVFFQRAKVDTDALLVDDIHPLTLDALPLDQTRLAVDRVLLAVGKRGSRGAVRGKLFALVFDTAFERVEDRSRRLMLITELWLISRQAVVRASRASVCFTLAVYHVDHMVFLVFFTKLSSPESFFSVDWLFETSIMITLAVDHVDHAVLLMFRTVDTFLFSWKVITGKAGAFQALLVGDVDHTGATMLLTDDRLLAGKVIRRFEKTALVFAYNLMDIDHLWRFMFRTV